MKVIKYLVKFDPPQIGMVYKKNLKDNKKYMFLV